MAVSIKFKPMDRELKILVDKALSPEIRQSLIARVAREGIAEGDAVNRAALGASPPHTETVDGRQGAPLESVNPDNGIIVARWEFLNEVVAWVNEELRRVSPVRSGRYRDSHVLLADGVEVEPPATGIVAKEWGFVSTVPYARKIEPGIPPGRAALSKQALKGVYLAVAADARQRFGNIAIIRFTLLDVNAPGSMLEAWASGKDHSHLGEAAGRRQRLKDRRNPAITITTRE